MSDIDYFDPDNSRHLAYLIFSDRKGVEFGAAQAAYLFGCDVDALGEAQRSHEEVSESWTASALQARGEGEPEYSELCLHEARAWASAANLLRDAAGLCRARGLARAEWPLAGHVRRYREASAQRWHVFHVVRDRLWPVVEEPDCCGDECCEDACCGGDLCECEGCLIDWSQCTVCGQVRPSIRDTGHLLLSVVESDEEVVAAKQREERLLTELFEEFDEAFAQWRRDTGVGRDSGVD